ncbi:MAG: bifunctional adenosylcobinamide kinase/adenosylcobinamide-phosphate guanylyltransferase, partial [Clostridia bacterium]|nr:bifunctional adenosylcobinamide kinase/adenosylcobinamide-phosphate guanylyltransferase [Clostridia bacterium]
IADEIGCGIIPLEKSDRIYREALGRFLCDLAAISDTVIRVTCGIPTFIKGE